MKHRVTLVVFLTFIAIFGLLFWKTEGDRTPPLVALSESTKSGQKRVAPDFELLDFGGKNYKLSMDQGKVRVVHFWASWCPPCLEEIHEFLAAMKKAKEMGVVGIAISLDPSWAEAHKIVPSGSFPGGVISLLDSKQLVSEKFGSFQYPETYLIGKSGEILQKFVGPQAWNSDLMRKLLEAAGARN